MSRGAPFVVLGGGPCGLSAAWELARRGRSVVVLEREPLVGGLCATHEEGGFRFDLGGHRFVSSDEELSRWLEALLGDDLLTQERRSVVLHDGRTFRYPLEAADLVKNLGLATNVRALGSYAAARARRALRPRPDVSFEDWVTARFGRSLYDVFFGPYTAKLWGRDPRELSADWAAERISLLDLGDAALRLLGKDRPPIRTYARRYRYPRLGMGQLYTALAREIERLGGVVRTGARVVGCATRGRRVVAIEVETARGRERVEASQVLSTAPLPDLARWLGLAPAAAPPPLRFRALVFLNLALARSDFSENTWTYVASARFRTSRIQEPKRRSVAMAPPGRTSIMLEIPCDVGDDVWSADAPELTARMQRELAAMGLPASDVTSAFTVRVEHGYPVYHLGYDADRRALLERVARFENVRTAGRQGLFRYVFMDAAMAMGRAAAEQMIDGVVDPDAIDRIGRGAGRVIETTALTA